MRAKFSFEKCGHWTQALEALCWFAENADARSTLERNKAVQVKQAVRRMVCGTWPDDLLAVAASKNEAIFAGNSKSTKTPESFFCDVVSRRDYRVFHV